MTEQQNHDLRLLLGRVEGKLDMALGQQLDLKIQARHTDNRLRAVEAFVEQSKGFRLGALAAGAAGGVGASQLVSFLF